MCGDIDWLCGVQATEKSHTLARSGKTYQNLCHQDDNLVQQLYLNRTFFFLMHPEVKFPEIILFDQKCEYNLA